MNKQKDEKKKIIKEIQTLDSFLNFLDKKKQEREDKKND
jgi:hypothetical protein